MLKLFFENNTVKIYYRDKLISNVYEVPIMPFAKDIVDAAEKVRKGGTHRYLFYQKFVYR